MKPKQHGLQSGDFWGGAAGTAVILPQAMAFGVALWAAGGLSASTGALTGLLGAAILCFVSGVAGGTRGMISSPTGPMLVLQVAAIVGLSEAGLQGNALITGFASVLLLTGLFQFLIGFSGGGRLVKFLPYPVVSGFITGSGILMLLSQYKPLTIELEDALWDNWLWLPVATAALTFVTIKYSPRFLPKLPGTITGLAVGTLFFQLALLMGPGGVPQQWVIGAIPNPANLEFALSLEALSKLPWMVVVTSALALAVLASIDTLITAVIADVETRVRHSSRRELMGQGVGQILAGLGGGMAGAGTTGATLVSIHSGGLRWAAAFAGLIIFALILFGGAIGKYMPLSVLAGVILFVAVGMLDKHLITWLRSERTRMDGVIALLVTLVTVGYDLMVAVGVGVLIAIILFIRNEVRSPVIHRKSNIGQVHSVRARTTEERAALDFHQDRVMLYELRGNLFFATADRLFEELEPDLNRNAYLILSLQRVRHVDMTAIKILQQIAERLHSHGGRLAFCEVHSALGLGKHMHKALKKVSKRASKWKVPTFLGADDALAWAEDQVLEACGSKPYDLGQYQDLAGMDLCDEMTPAQIETLRGYMHKKKVKENEVIFRRNEQGSELYIVQQGQVDIRLPTTAHHYLRLATYGAGTVFGIIAFFDPGKRAADAVAVADSQLLFINEEGLSKLNREHPQIALILLRSLGKIQGQDLRWSARELKRLSQW